MNLSVAPNQFTEAEAPELTEYRPVNRFAILSAVFGGLSGLGLLHPLFLIFPVVGVAAGLFASWQLAPRDSLQSGMTAAKWGVFLSLFFGIWVAANVYSRQQLLANQAKAYSEQWLKILSEGKLLEAHQLMLNQGRRVPAGTSLEKHYEMRPRTKPSTSTQEPSSEQMNEMMEEAPHEELKKFTDLPITQRVSKLGTHAEYEYLRTLAQIQLSPSEMVVRQRFAVNHNHDGKSERFEVDVNLERTEINRIANWRVDSIVPAASE